jgi:hypothetical protein
MSSQTIADIPQYNINMNLFEIDYTFNFPTSNYIFKIIEILEKNIIKYRYDTPSRAQFIFEIIYRFITYPPVLNKLSKKIIDKYLERLDKPNLDLPFTFNKQYYKDVLIGNMSAENTNKIPSYVKPSSKIIKFIELCQTQIIKSEEVLLGQLNTEFPIPIMSNEMSSRMFDYWKNPKLDIFNEPKLENYRIDKSKLFHRMKSGAYATLWKYSNYLIRVGKFDKPLDDKHLPNDNLLIHECNLHITACLNTILCRFPFPHFIPVYNQLIDNYNKRYYQLMDYTPIVHLTSIKTNFTDELMFQALMTFIYLQERVHLVHNDLHFNNVAIQENTYNENDIYTYYDFDGKKYKINTYKHGLLKIFDFDLSCIYDIEFEKTRSESDLTEPRKISVINKNLQELSEHFPYYPEVYKSHLIDTPNYMFDFITFLYNIVREVNIDKDAHLTKYLIKKYLFPNLSYTMKWTKSHLGLGCPEYIQHVFSHPNCSVKDIEFHHIRHRNIKWVAENIVNSPFRTKSFKIPNEIQIFTDFSVPEEQRSLTVKKIMNYGVIIEHIRKFQCSDKSH